MVQASAGKPSSTRVIVMDSSISRCSADISRCGNRAERRAGACSNSCSPGDVRTHARSQASGVAGQRGAAGLPARSCSRDASQGPQPRLSSETTSCSISCSSCRSSASCSFWARDACCDAAWSASAASTLSEAAVPSFALATLLPTPKNDRPACSSSCPLPRETMLRQACGSKVVTLYHAMHISRSRAGIGNYWACWCASARSQRI